MSFPILTPEDSAEQKSAARAAMEAARPEASDHRSWEEWAVQENTPDWLLAAARQFYQWAVGRTMTREFFKDALEKVSGITCR